MRTRSLLLATLAVILSWPSVSRATTMRSETKWTVVGFGKILAVVVDGKPRLFDLAKK